MMRSTRRDEGFALAALICLISAAAVLTAVMVPLRVMQSRRETEQELIFRGQEYIRAIQKYQRKYGVYPSSIDDLVSRDGYRFIRRQYKDPVTGEDFRLINVNADGSLTGSLTLLISSRVEPAERCSRDNACCERNQPLVGKRRRSRWRQ